MSSTSPHCSITLSGTQKKSSGASGSSAAALLTGPPASDSSAPSPASPALLPACCELAPSTGLGRSTRNAAIGNNALLTSALLLCVALCGIKCPPKELSPAEQFPLFCVLLHSALAAGGTL